MTITITTKQLGAAAAVGLLLLAGAGLNRIRGRWAKPEAAGKHAHAEGEKGEHGEHGEHGEESPMLEVDKAAAKAIDLRTETLMPAVSRSTHEATGRVVAVEARQAHLGSRLNGRLRRMAVRAGQRVTAGQVVATLDSVDATQAAAAHREASARLAASQRNLANRRQLAASGLYSAGPLGEARRQLAEARLEQARIQTELGQARHEADAAKAELQRVQRLAERGSYTSAAAEEAGGKLAEAERGLAEAGRAVADAQAERSEAHSAVQSARTKLHNAQGLLERTRRLAAVGDLDHGPLEAAQNTLADARSRLQQAEAALEQARRHAKRGEELHRSELVSQNDLEARRTAVREREAQVAEAQSAVRNATAAVRRQEQISGARMTSGRALQEAENQVAELRSELAAAEARLARAEAKVKAAGAVVTPAEAAVASAKSGHAREVATAGDQTRAASAIDAVRLRLAQATRAAQGKQGEAGEAARKVRVAEAALVREDRLSAGSVRVREQLLESEREVTQAQVARDNAAEVLRLLGASRGQGGQVEVPIRSPLTGLVTKVEASVGEAVNPDKDLVTVVDLGEVYVEADVYEKDLPKVRNGQAARIAVRAVPGRAFAGSVVSIGGALDPQTRAAHVRVLLSNPGWHLKPEMFANVAFVTDEQAGVLSVASEAVQEVEGRQVVFVQRSPEQYELRPVEVGEAADGRRRVLSGLKAGEVVVTKGSYLLKSQRLKNEMGHGCS